MTDYDSTFGKAIDRLEEADAVKPGVILGDRCGDTFPSRHAARAAARVRACQRSKLLTAGITMQGLLNAIGTRLREAGVDLDDIRRVHGQKTLVMAQL